MWIEGHRLELTRRGRALELLEEWRLREWMGRGTRFSELRLHAIVLLIWDGALQLSDVLKLDVDQVLVDPDGDVPRIASSVTLRADQANRSREHTFPISYATEKMLERYLLAAKERGWMGVGGWRGPLFIGARRRCGASGHERLFPDAAQRSLAAVQAHPDFDKPFNFHDLRHHAILLHPGDVKEKARFGRISEKDAALYMDPDPHGFSAAWRKYRLTWPEHLRELEP